MHRTMAARDMERKPLDSLSYERAFDESEHGKPHLLQFREPLRPHSSVLSPRSSSCSFLRRIRLYRTGTYTDTVTASYKRFRIVELRPQPPILFALVHFISPLSTKGTYILDTRSKFVLELSHLICFILIGQNAFFVWLSPKSCCMARMDIYARGGID